MTISPASSRPHSPHRWLTVAVAGALLLYAVAAVYDLATTPLAQWDFATYYYAGRAIGRGQNPYDQAVLASLMAADGNLVPSADLPFVYTPLSLPLFSAFSVLPYALAVRLWLLFKVLLLGVLLVIWRRNFLPGASWPLLGLFGLLAFGATVYIDLQAGNVSTIEQVLIWSAFGALLRRRGVLFAALVLLAAVFKINALLLLGLLVFFWPTKKAAALIVGAIVAFALVVFASFTLVPSSGLGFLANAGQIALAAHERGYVNSSALALATDLVNQAAHALGLVAPAWLPLAAFGLFAAVVMGVTVLVLLALNLNAAPRRPELERLTIFVFCAAYMLVMPRLKNYSYILLIPPAFYLAQALQGRSALPLLLFILLVQPATAHNLFKLAGPIGLFWDYYLFFLAVATWVAGLLVVRDQRQLPPDPS